MKANIKTHARILIVIGLVLVLITQVAAATQTQTFNVIPPDSTYNGLTYAEWSAKWWQWGVSVPVKKSPFIDPTGENCDQGQSGPVWFLAGTFVAEQDQSGAVVGAATRNCNIPVRKAIFSQFSQF